MPSTYYVAWWNLENSFDEENSPRRTEKLQRAIGADLAGWTPARRDRKISQLASVIAQMNGGAGPDLLGVCEVENRFVLDLLVATLGTPLPGRNYDIVQADTEDERGIDVAFIYDADLFEVPDDQVFFHVVMRRNATRELVQSELQDAEGPDVVGVREPLAVPQRGPVRVGRLSVHGTPAGAPIVGRRRITPHRVRARARRRRHPHARRGTRAAAGSSGRCRAGRFGQ